MRYRQITLTIALFVSAATAAGAQISDGGFETQAATVSNYCYFGSVADGNPACPAGAWTGTSGLQDESNSAWPGIDTPDGSKYGFVQSTGTLSQTFTADESGLFELTWLAAGRPNILSPDFGGDQSYMVSLNGFDLGTFSTVSGQAFTPESSETLFNLVLGQSYTLTFAGLSNDDQTSFIDAVQLASAVPEASTWAMMLIGFGAVGAASRRQKARRRSIIVC